MELLELDDLDRRATDAFPGHMVRKDLVRQFRGQFLVPTYVVEFMLGRYCASTDPAEIEEGVEMVREQLTARTIRADEEELFKARARERGSVRMIDIIKAPLDARTDSYLARLPSLRLNDVRIADRLVNEHERMLTGGFYTEIELDRAGESRAPVRSIVAAGDSAVDSRHPGQDRPRAAGADNDGIERLAVAQRWFRAGCTVSPRAGPARAISSNRFRPTRI
jgi:predicted ATP-dependent Lon-type protease